MKQHTVGIDISKAHLDAHRLADGHAAQFDNDPAGFRALIDWIGTPVECIAYEATGPYHRDLEEALSKAKLPLAKVNPWQARRFAEATGSRAKTDAVDARKLAQLAATLEPRRTQVPSKTQRRLQDLQTSRDALMRQRTAALNRRRQLREPLLKQQNQIQINMFERHLRAIDRKLQTLIAADEARAHKLEILTSIPGIAATTTTGSAGRDARAGRPQRQGRRQSGRAGRRSSRVGGLAGPGLHPGRTGAGATAPVHAGGGRPALEPRLGRGVPEAERARQARQGGPRRRHAQAYRPGQHPRPAGPHLVARSAPSDLLRPRRDPVRKGSVWTP